MDTALFHPRLMRSSLSSAFTACLVVSLAFAQPALSQWFVKEVEIVTGVVMQVEDGDTYFVRTSDGRQLSVRLWGVDGEPS